MRILKNIAFLSAVAVPLAGTAGFCGSSAANEQLQGIFDEDMDVRDVAGILSARRHQLADLMDGDFDVRDVSVQSGSNERIRDIDEDDLDVRDVPLKYGSKEQIRDLFDEDLDVRDVKRPRPTMRGMNYNKAAALFESGTVPSIQKLAGNHKGKSYSGYYPAQGAPTVMEAYSARENLIFSTVYETNALSGANSKVFGDQQAYRANALGEFLAETRFDALVASKSTRHMNWGMHDIWFDVVYQIRKSGDFLVVKRMCYRNKSVSAPEEMGPIYSVFPLK